jgi:hypothetical protein
MDTYTTATLTPVEIDTLVLDLSWKQFCKADRVQAYYNHLKRFVGREERGASYTAERLHPTEDRKMSNAEAREIALNLLDTDPSAWVYSNGSRKSERSIWGRGGSTLDDSDFSRIETAEAELAEITAELTALQAEFVSRGGWDRYFLVASSSGHIHSSTSCHTCNKGKNPTQFALVPSLSNMKVDVAVEALGAGLCSICFPDAPVEMQEQMKISQSLATVLREKGESAFVEARQKAQARALKKAGK